jgi:uncharacterized repeat protein (TIGR01451 family)/fimbrial isopeptide formation D2 family protein
MVFLLSLSNFLPYSAQYAQANETPSLSDLELTQDVDGEERKEVEKGTTFTFNIDALIPEDGSNEGTLTILNQVDKQLAIEHVEVVVNDEESDLEAVVEGQDVSLDLAPEQLATVAGQHVTLKITAAFQDEVEAGTEIEHVAEAFINGELAEKAEPVTVALLADATSEEEEAPAEEEAQQEEENAGEESSEEEQTSEEEKPSEEEQGTEEEAEGEEDAASVADVNANNVLDINDVDSYGISINTVDGALSQIRQFDGNNFSADPKAIVMVTGIPGNVNLNNGLAVHPTENAFYAYGASPEIPHGLYRIAPDGTAELVGNLDGVAANGVISQDGERYYHTYEQNGSLVLGTYNLVTGEKETTPISGYPSTEAGGDVIIDGNGYMWFSNNSAGVIIQMNPDTGEVLRQVPITSSDGKALTGGVRGLSFLPNGQILLSSGRGPDANSSGQSADYYSLDPDTLQTTFLGSATIPGEGRLHPSYDLASRVYPVFDPLPPELDAEKSVEVLEKGEGNTDEEHAEVGDTLRYTIQARNTVSDSLVQSMVISDTIPEGLEYVPGTLKVDGEAVTDDEDDDEGHYVDGGVVGNFGDVTDTDWHTLEFDVIVLPGQAGKDIENTALADGNNIDEPKEPSELVEVYPREGPVVEAEKTVSPEGEVFAGNILTYDVTIKNVGEHIAADAVFEDAIPEGTEYVPDSLKIVAGPNTGDLTDEEDDDAGHFAGDKVIIELGNLETTTDLPDGVTVQFQVKTLESHVGETVVNQADIQYRNLQTDEEQSAQSNEVANEIVETPDIDACALPVALVNGDFEKPEGPGTYDNSVAGGGYYYADTVPGWETTDVARTPRGIIQIMDPARPSTIPHNAENLDNLTSRFAELNADTHSMLYQELPTVPGQTIYWRLDHRSYTGVDTMSVNIGPVTADPFNTTPEIQRFSTGSVWETYSGSYTVPAGQTVTRFGFKAISTSTGALAFGNYIDNTFLGTEPCVVAEKTVSPEGEVFEGDQLTYEVTVKNNGGDIAADTVIEDAIPEGTEFVPGSMKILNGPKEGDLTDGNDDDAGHFDGDKVIINIGDLPNTTELEDGITVQFKVKTLSSHVGETVVNKATVGYKNLLTGEDGTTETNEVSNPIIEREDIDACANPVALVNGSFEGGPARGSYNPATPWMFLESEVPGWRTTDNAVGQYIIEIWDYAQQYPSGVRTFPAPPDGNRYAELNAYDNGLLYQDVETTPGQTIKWRLSHMGRGGVDTMQLRIGQSTDNPYDTEIIEQMSDGPSAWGTYTGTYTVPAGQTVTRFGFEAVSTASGNLGAGNFLDDIFLGTEPCVEAEKTVSPEGEVTVGDELTYEVTVKNTGGDIAADAVFEDAIPEGTEYVPGSIKILTGPNAGDLTDADDNDAGHFDGDKVIIQLGDLPNTTDLPDGITVQFKVKTLASHANDVVVNQANIGYKNLLTDEDETTDTNEVETPIVYQKPVIESEKNATLLEKAEGNTDEDNPEVGDTLLYTIQARNTLEGSIVENFVIFDVIPEGLEYVPGTLKVNGEAVTDDEDDDEGHYTDGEVFGSFGDVTDTEWQTLEFQVIVSEGQAGQDIENVAFVDGDNFDEPDEPREEVKIYPREPKLESRKSAKMQMKAKSAMKSATRLCTRLNPATRSLIACLKTSPSQTSFQKG